MKKLIKLLTCTLIFSVVCTQLTLIVSDLLGISQLRQRNVATLIYLSCVAVSGIVLIGISYMPRLPMYDLRAVLEKDGYTREYYAIMMKWHDVCVKRGFPNIARLTLAESLIDGGHIEKGLDILRELNVKKLDRQHKQVYYNTLLYAAVCQGEQEAAESIYKTAAPWLHTATSRAIAASVKHTLGCYEYMRGDLKRAETLFVQALGSEPSPDVICELRIGLTLCYLDTGRLKLAKESADMAARYASTAPLREKLARTRKLAEAAFRQKLSETA
ncbi:MAG: hypothetical protein IJ723_07920 [Ruminococcus sp.]|nr:hypothetical protein [Ruminococcus sp.]